MSAAFAPPDRFSIIRKLGSGGAGVVYEAVDREHGNRVALKLLRGQEPGALLRFKQEFRALQGLVHPNLVRLGELIEHTGVWFFTMEFVAGVDFLTYVSAPEAAAAADQKAETVTENIDLARVRAAAVAGAREPQHVAAPLFDEDKLRAALGQLARGVSVLHAAGKVHRDIKPSNLLCTDAGRVVILDFGLVLDTVQSNEHTAPGFLLGTPAYMAPEQVVSGEVGPAADWYAVGVLLYRALTSRLPFSGDMTDMLMRKQHLSPASPTELGLRVPADLEELCMQLLSVDPSRRPSEKTVLSLLLHNHSSSHHMLAAKATIELYGRESETALLAKAFDESRTGGPIVVQVSGESGIGKSALVRHFCHQVGERGAVVLTGRCYERESVPYKAVDGVIDSLTHALSRLPPAELKALLPPNIEFLARMFPVLLRVDAIARVTTLRKAAGDHHEGRRRASRALRELLARLAASRPLVLLIDDTHWGDEDSLALLREALHSGDAPRLLLLATARLAEGAPLRFDLSTLPCEVRQMRLDPLTPDSARALARSLLERVDAASTAPANANALALESGGHPLFIEALAHHLSSGTRRSNRPIALEEALWSRIERLDPPARAVLELLVIAGQPIPLESLASAAGTDVAEIEGHVAALRSASFALSGGARRADVVELYHDRIRAAVWPHLSNSARAHGHGRLALALESSPSADPEAIAQHWRDAERTDRAAQFAEMAAVKAHGAFAFERAARLFALAIELSPDDDRVRGWRLALGDALANAGHGQHSAEIYLTAAEAARPNEALALRRRAAEQLLITGHVDAGREVMRGVLSAVGIRLPRSPLRALLAMLLRRAQLRLRGLRYRERDESELAPSTLARIDVCCSAAMGLGFVDTISASLFQARNVILSLAAGEPFRVARALIMEAHFSAMGGNRSARRTAALVKRAHEVAARSNDPRVQCGARAAAGIGAFCEGRWADAEELLAEANRLIEEHRTGDPWDVFEIDETKIFYLSSLIWRGELAELSRTRPRMLREAEQRGDRFAMAHMQTGIQIINWLMRDDVAGARLIADQTFEMCPRQGTHVPHFLDLAARIHIDLYDGDAASAHQRALEWWPRMRRSLLLEVQYVRVAMLDLLGRSTLAHAVAKPGPLGDRLLREVLRIAKRLVRERVAWASALGQVLLAGAATARGEPNEAVVSALTRAAEGLDAADMGLHAAVVRSRLGRAMGGAKGRALVTAMDHWFAAQGVVNPESLSQVILPGVRSSSRDR
jgi:serine/threonine protein kinase